MTRRTPGHYYKQQTIRSYFPPVIHGEVGYGSIRLLAASGYSNDAEAPIGFRCRHEVAVELTPHEAMSLAAWLSDHAERLNAKAAKKLATALARRAAREGKQL